MKIGSLGKSKTPQKIKLFYFSFLHVSGPLEQFWLKFCNTRRTSANMVDSFQICFAEVLGRA
jgi:hypothetical protein